MPILLLAAVAFAILFYRAADYEHMSPLAWAAGSIGLTVLVGMLGRGIGTVFLAQIALFVAMWWYNAFRARR
jgi:hypothetical protein